MFYHRFHDNINYLQINTITRKLSRSIYPNKKFKKWNWLFCNCLYFILLASPLPDDFKKYLKIPIILEIPMFRSMASHTFSTGGDEQVTMIRQIITDETTDVSLESEKHQISSGTATFSNILYYFSFNRRKLISVSFLYIIDSFVE